MAWDRANASWLVSFATRLATRSRMRLASKRISSSGARRSTHPPQECSLATLQPTGDSHATQVDIISQIIALVGSRLDPRRVRCALHACAPREMACVLRPLFPVTTSSIGSTVAASGGPDHHVLAVLGCLHDLSTECRDRHLGATCDALRSRCAALLDVVDIDCCMKIGEARAQLGKDLGRRCHMRYHLERDACRQRCRSQMR